MVLYDGGLVCLAQSILLIFEMVFTLAHFLLLVMRYRGALLIWHATINVDHNG